MKQSHKTLLLWGLLIMMFVAIWQFLSPNPNPTAQVAFSEFIAQVRADKEKDPHVESVAIKAVDKATELTFWVNDPKAQELATAHEKLAVAIQKRLDEQAPPLAPE